jgi:hypothetical protein
MRPKSQEFTWRASVDEASTLRVRPRTDGNKIEARDLLSLMTPDDR